MELILALGTSASIRLADLSAQTERDCFTLLRVKDGLSIHSLKNKQLSLKINSGIDGESAKRGLSSSGAFTLSGPS